MSEGAKVDSIDALKALKGAMLNFSEAATAGLADAEAEMARVLVWLETEQLTYWQGQIRKRHDAVEKAKEALRMKQLYKGPAGSKQSTVEEEKAVGLAKRRLEEAEGKLQNVRRYMPRLQKEVQLYKGGVQRFATTVQSDIPVAVAQLNRMIDALEAYVKLASDAVEMTPSATEEPPPPPLADGRGS